MVLESLINPKKAIKKPWHMFFIGLFYSFIAVFIALWIFRQDASLMMVFLVVMASMPFVYRLIKEEEEKDILIESETKILKEHSKAIYSLMYLFLGTAIAYMACYLLLPQSLTQFLFTFQERTIIEINTNIAAGYIRSFEVFSQILFNNIKVLTFCILFAFIYGLGAIFILTWNASVIGTAIGIFVKSKMLAGTSVFVSLPLGLYRYFLHGIPEILAYFVGGLAGGIISVAIIKHDFGTKKFEKIILDSSELITISLVILFIAALIESYITPLIF